jgi:DNA-binding CsgD family transcriptional regulator
MGLVKARECGALVLAERAEQELLASGGRLPKRPLTGGEALTPTERRVAELAAKGLSNPEIAASLFVSRRTVETHLTHVYDKLGCGRADLPTALA